MEDFGDREDDFVLLALGRQYAAVRSAVGDFEEAADQWEQPVGNWLKHHSDELDTRMEALVAAICMRRAETPAGALLQIKILEAICEWGFEDGYRQLTLERMRNHAMFSIARVLGNAAGPDLKFQNAEIDCLSERDSPFIEEVDKYLALMEYHCRTHEMTFRRMPVSRSRTA